MSTVNENVSAAVADVVTSQITGKKWYWSKTFWINVVMATALSIQMKYGFVIGPELQAYIISGVNLALRKLTKEAIVW
jgi:hypothetical protein